MIILVAHVKGGVGKSTITVNVAAELQRLGKDVLIVEADPTVRTVSNWARDRDESELAKIPCVQKGGNIHSTLKDLSTRYDVVLVDAAGKDSKEMRTALTAASVVLVPMQPSQADLDTAEAFVTTVTEAQDFNPNLRVLGVLNRASTHATNSDVQEAREYMASFPELPLAGVVLHERKSYQRCLEDGRGVVEMKDPKAKAEIQILTQEVMAW